MEVREKNGTAELVLDESESVAVIPLEHYRELVESDVKLKIFRNMWYSDMLEDEFGTVLEAVFGDRYLGDAGEDESDAE